MTALAFFVNVCDWCKKEFPRRPNENPARYRKRKYCSLACVGHAKEDNPFVPRSSYHRRARKHRKPACEKCGAMEELEVHHVDGDWTNNEPSNLRTLCKRECHKQETWRAFYAEQD